MDGSIADALLSPRARRAADAALAVGLGLLAVADLLLSSDPSSWGGRGPLQVCLALGCTLPLAWRVRRPIATVAVITAAGGLLVAVAAPHQAPFEVFVGSVLAAYSIGAHTAGHDRASNWQQLDELWDSGGYSTRFGALSASAATIRGGRT